MSSPRAHRGGWSQQHTVARVLSCLAILRKKLLTRSIVIGAFRTCWFQLHEARQLAIPTSRRLRGTKPGGREQIRTYVRKLLRGCATLCFRVLVRGHSGARGILLAPGRLSGAGDNGLGSCSWSRKANCPCFMPENCPQPPPLCCMFTPAPAGETVLRPAEPVSSLSMDHVAHRNATGFLQ